MSAKSTVRDDVSDEANFFAFHCHLIMQCISPSSNIADIKPMFVDRIPIQFFEQHVHTNNQQRICARFSYPVGHFFFVSRPFFHTENEPPHKARSRWQKNKYSFRKIMEISSWLVTPYNTDIYSIREVV